MQPLSYQVLAANCWPTSAINAMMTILHRRSTQAREIPHFVFQMLYAAVESGGTGGGGRGIAGDWQIALEAACRRCKLSSAHFLGSEVQDNWQDRIESQIEGAFGTSAVICDVRSGSHSMMLSAKRDGWYYGFDPDWELIQSLHRRQNLPIQTTPHSEYSYLGNGLIPNLSFRPT